MKGRTLFQVLICTLLLIGAILPWTTPRAQGQSTIPVVGADGVFEANTSLSPDLTTQLDQIPQTYFPVGSPDGIGWLGMDVLPTVLNALLNQIPDSYFPVSGADGVFIGNMAYPAALLQDTTPPEIFNVSVNQITGLVQWKTNEFATSEVRHGTQPGNYTHVVTDTLFVKNHQLLMTVPSEAQHILIRSADRSGNWGEYYVPGFSVSGRVSDESGGGIVDAVLSASPTQLTQSDALGEYILPGLAGGEQVITPYHPEYVFEPKSITLTLTANVEGVNFVGKMGVSYLIASSVPFEQIDLTWQDNSPDESEFHIERSTDGTNWKEIATVPADTESYSDTNVTCSTTYYYRVRAHWHGDNHFSPFSNEASTTTSPCQPTSLVATPVEYEQLDIIWQDNSPDESEFHIERSPDGVNWVEIATVPAGTESYSDTNLTCSTTYYYRVRAHRHADAQYSRYSNVVSKPTLPCSPSNLSASPSSYYQIHLTWQDNSPDESEFRIERSPGGVNWVEIATVSANTTSYSDTNRSCDTMYYYRIRARRSVSEYSSFSNIANARTFSCLKVFLPFSINDSMGSQDTRTFYSNMTDGEVTNRWCISSWNICRNAPAGNAAWDYLSVGTVGAIRESGGDFTLSRLFLFFDTSAIPTNAQITSARLTIYAGQYQNGNKIIHAVRSTANNPLTTSDFSKIGFVSGGSTTPSSPYVWVNIDLNATALNWIVKNGMTRLALIHYLDLYNIEPTMANDVLVGLTEDPLHLPHLTVTYSTP